MYDKAHETKDFETALIYTIGRVSKEIEVTAVRLDVSVIALTIRVGEVLAGEEHQSILGGVRKLRSQAPGPRKVGVSKVALAGGSQQKVQSVKKDVGRDLLQCPDCDRVIDTRGLHKHLLAHNYPAPAARIKADKIRKEAKGGA